VCISDFGGCFCDCVCISAITLIVSACPCIAVIVFCDSVYISAATLIGVLQPDVRSAILWAFRFESNDLVRAEACRAVTLLDLEGSDVITVLQERYLVEDSDTVKR